MTDYLIVGAGPAGLQLGYCLMRAGRDYTILEAGATAGTFFRTYPRHRTMISNNKVYTGTEDPELNLRWDWNSLLCDEDRLRFRHYTKRFFPPADEMVRYLSDFAGTTGLRVEYNKRVSRIGQDGVFHVSTEDGAQYSAKRLVIATGVTLDYLPPIPGIEYVEPYSTMSVDADEFQNLRVLILGKGNSAFETAEYLSASAAIVHLASPSTVKMAWRTHYVGHLRAVNNNILDSYQLKSQHAVIDAHCERIEHRGDRFIAIFRYIRANEVQEIEYDRILCCTGFRFDASIFDKEVRPSMVINNRFPEQTSEWESVNVKDLYFAGTLMQMRDFKRSQSSFIHGFRYNVAALCHMLQAKYEGVDWPHRNLEAQPEAIRDAIIDRINRSSGLWQQFGFLCDAITLDGDVARYYEDVPIDYVRDSRLNDATEYYLVTLEYGHSDASYDPFQSHRIARHDFKNAEESKFLHPVVRRYAAHQIVSEHHVIEDLFSEWKRSEHREPLLSFVQQTTAMAVAG